MSVSNPGTGPWSLLLGRGAVFLAPSALRAASFETEGSAVNSSERSGAPLASARRNESIGGSSSPQTLAVSRFQPLASVTGTPKRSASSERYARSVSTSVPFQNSLKAPEAPAQSDADRVPLPL